MKNPLRILITAALVASFSAKGAEVGTLNLKVDLQIEKIFLDEARIILLPENGKVSLLEDLGTKIDLKLDLGTAYLIEFQRPGCTTRQLMVDTRMKGNMASIRSMEARAQMKLVVPKRGQDFEFSGPVGYIYYNEAADSFLYHTDYRMVGEQAMIDRMNMERERFALPDALVVVPKRGYIIHPGYEFGTKVTTGTNNAPLLHRTNGDAPEEPIMPVAEVVEPLAPVVQPVAPVAAPVAAITLPVAAPVAMIAAVVQPIETAALPVFVDPSISEELTVSRARIIKDVKVSREGHTEIFRKVTERYGAVYYFKDGISCSEYAYRSGTAPIDQPTFVTSKCSTATCSR